MVGLFLLTSSDAKPSDIMKDEIALLKKCIEEEVSTLKQADLDKITWGVISDWLIRCPLDFLEWKSKCIITIDEIIGRPFTFNKRPEHLPCDMRPLWRCSLLLIIFLVTGRAGCCSLKKLHLINWMLKSENNEAMFEFWLLNKEGLKPEVRLDPT